MFKFIDRWSNLNWRFMLEYPDSKYTRDDWHFVTVTFIFVLVLVALSSILWLYPFIKNCRVLQIIYCAIGWHCHRKDYIFNYFDGSVDHCTCKWCKKKGYLYEDRKFIVEEDKHGRPVK